MAHRLISNLFFIVLFIFASESYATVYCHMNSDAPNWEWVNSGVLETGKNEDGTPRYESTGYYQKTPGSRQVVCFEIDVISTQNNYPHFSPTAATEGQKQITTTPTETTDCPVNIATGHKILSRSEYMGSGEFPLSINRQKVLGNLGPYGLFGHNWFSELDLSIGYSLKGQLKGCGRGFNSYNQACSKSVKLEDIDVLSLYRIGGAETFKWNGTQQKWLSTSGNYTSFIPTPLADGAWKVVDELTGDIERYHFNGRINKRENVHGVSWTYQYASDTATASGLQSVTHSSGRKLSFNTAMSHIGEVTQTVITDPNGFVYTFDIDNGLDHYQQNGVQTLTYPNGTGTYKLEGGYGYWYNEYVDGTLHKEHNYANYDRVRRVKSSGLAGGYKKSTFNYIGNQTIVTNAKGAVTTYTYAEEDRKSLMQLDRGDSGACPSAAAQQDYFSNNTLKWKEDWQGSRTSYTYTPQKQIATYYQNGVTKEYVWSDYGLIKEIRIWHGTIAGVVCKSGDPCLPAPSTPESKIVYEYYPASHAARYRVKSVTEYDNQGNASTTQITYVIGSNKLVRKKTIDGPRSDVADTTVYTYNTRGDLTRIDLPNGDFTTYEYQGTDDRPWRVTDANGHSQTITYDARNRVTGITTNDEPAQVTRIEYNGLSQITLLNGPNGRIVNEYNGAGFLTTRYLGTDSLARIEYEYDLLGNVTKVTTRDTRVIKQRVQTGQHSWGWASFPDYSYHYARATFDEAGLLQSVDNHEGQPQLTYHYDKNARVDTITDTLNRVTRMTYTPDGALETLTNPKNETVIYDYDPLQRLTSASDGMGKSFRYERLGDEVQAFSPDVVGLSRQTDDAGNVVQRAPMAGSGPMVDYVYDELNRLTQLAASTGEVQSLFYDSYRDPVTGADCGKGVGRLCGYEDLSGSTSFAYKTGGQLERITTTIQGQTYTRTYAYDSLGRLETKQFPNGVKLRYGYDPLNNVNKIEAYVGSAWTTIFSADVRVAESKLTYGNGIEEIIEKDLDGRLKSQGTKTYGYTAASELNAITHSGNTTANQSYAYDLAGRLQTVTSGLGNQSFTYDASGNRKTHVWGGATDTYTYSSGSNRLSAITGSRAKSFTYDDNGNLTKKIGHGGTYTYQYDGFNRLKQANTTSYKNNAENQRAYKTGPGGTYRYLYDGAGRVEAETGKNSNSIASIYVYWQNRPVALIRNNTIYYIQTDHLGRPEVATNASKTVVWKANNTAFDRQVTTNTIGGLNLGFPGQYYDSETGLWYNWHRYYDASVGRYIQSDPVGMEGGLNTYNYALNNPAALIDPSGLAPCGCEMPYTPESGHAVADSADVHYGPLSVEQAEDINRKAAEQANNNQLFIGGLGVGVGFITSPFVSPAGGAAISSGFVAAGWLYGSAMASSRLAQTGDVSYTVKFTHGSHVTNVEYLVNRENGEGVISRRVKSIYCN